MILSVTIRGLCVVKESESQDKPHVITAVRGTHRHTFYLRVCTESARSGVSPDFTITIADSNLKYKDYRIPKGAELRFDSKPKVVGDTEGFEPRAQYEPATLSELGFDYEVITSDDSKEWILGTALLPYNAGEFAWMDSLGCFELGAKQARSQRSWS